jgi:hypothetical protein
LVRQKKSTRRSPSDLKTSKTGEQKRASQRNADQETAHLFVKAVDLSVHLSQITLVHRVFGVLWDARHEGQTPHGQRIRERLVTAI